MLSLRLVHECGKANVNQSVGRVVLVQPLRQEPANAHLSVYLLDRWEDSARNARSAQYPENTAVVVTSCRV